MKEDYSDTHFRKWCDSDGRDYNLQEDDDDDVSDDGYFAGRPDPVKIVSNREGLEANKYTLMWTVPMTGGAEISNYKVEYAVVRYNNNNSVHL